MDILKTAPNRSEVACWTANQLADYFKRIDFKECVKVVKKHGIDGQRFLDLSENDIQKFPKLKVPLITKLSQEIRKKEEKRGFFQKKPQAQRLPENTDYHQDDNGWSSFEEEEEEEDDYESPDEEEDGGDYESPTEDVQGNGNDNDSDNDYEPPPSNDEDVHPSVIRPAKPITGQSDYIDRPTSKKSPHNPPIPPQRPGATPMPPPIGNRGNTAPPLPPSNDDSSRQMRSSKSPAPSIDRSKKPPLDRPMPPTCDRDSPVLGKKLPFPEKSFTPPPPRPLFPDKIADASPKIPKPPIPSDRNSASLGRKPPSGRPPWGSGRNDDEDEDNIPQRPVPQPGGPPFGSNTFPYRSPKSSPKPVLSGSNSMPTPDSLSPSGSTPVPPRLLQASNVNRSVSRGSNDARPPIPLSNKQRFALPTPGDEGSLDSEWYVGQINRVEAESALKRINQDGTFLVRDSSKKTLEHPYVLVVLYNNKVYNVQIRYHAKDNSYLLGTGLRGRENFRSVSDIIEHFKRTPLHLIDGKDQDSRTQCTLTFSAARTGY